MDQFIDLIRTAGVRRVIDVRAIPRSRRHPQYDRDNLLRYLPAQAIDYHHLPELGGRRPRATDVAPEVNAFWANDGFHNFADYALSDACQTALDSLLTLSQQRPSAILCAEAVWWRCHRRIIADYLMDRGVPVFHLVTPGRIEPARPTPAARRSTDGRLVYPASAAD